MTASNVEIVEYTDPLCSIAWGTEPIKRRLLWRFGDRVKWRPVMAGLCRDNSKVEMFQPWNPFEAGQIYLKIWKRVTKLTEMPYPEDLRYMALTTDPPCLLVKAAENQGAEVAERVLRRFREAVFFYGTPVDALDQASSALVDVEGLDIEQLLEDCSSEKVRAAYLADWEETRRPNDYVRELADTNADHLEGPMMKSEGHERYNLPTFVFRGPEGERTVPGYRPYAEYESALEEVAPGLTKDAPANPTPDEALARWSTMTAKELSVLCEVESPRPSNAEMFSCCEAEVWLTGRDADYWRHRRA
jgi:predicted DsbA family dithiol-disulfide isomerase